MGYDTIYTITITAATKMRRKEIAAEIIKTAWLPYLYRKLEKGEYKDPVLSFQCRGWRTKELLDLGGVWYDSQLQDPDREKWMTGSLRGLELKEGECIYLVGRGDDDKDVYRIIATSTYVIRQTANIAFVSKEVPCPAAAEDVSEGEEVSECTGCCSCATIEATFPSINMHEDEHLF